MWERIVCNRYKNISPCLPTGRGKKSQITILAFQQGNVGSSYKTPTHYLVENKINVLLHTVVCSQNHHIESNLANGIEMGKMHLDGPKLSDVTNLLIWYVTDPCILIIFFIWLILFCTCGTLQGYYYLLTGDLHSWCSVTQVLYMVHDEWYT